MYLFSFSFLPVSFLGLNIGYALSKKGLRQQSPKFNKLQRKKVHRRRMNTVSHFSLLFFFHFGASMGKKVQTETTQRRANPWFIPKPRRTCRRKRAEEALTWFRLLDMHSLSLTSRNSNWTWEEREHFDRPTHGLFRTNEKTDPKRYLRSLSFFLPEISLI